MFDFSMRVRQNNALAAARLRFKMLIRLGLANDRSALEAGPRLQYAYLLISRVTFEVFLTFMLLCVQLGTQPYDTTASFKESKK